MTTTTNTAQGLLADIIEHPEDDDLRLIYADWLEDHGGEEGEARAEFIRSQVELATNPECNTVGRHCDSCEKLKRIERYWCETNRLSLQEKLLHFDVGLWRQKPEDGVYYPVAFFRRGFISEVHAPLAVLLQHLPALVRQHPIERVRATDKQPWGVRTGSILTKNEPCLAWHRRSRFAAEVGCEEQSDELPDDLYECLPFTKENDEGWGKYYPTAEAANEALSVALLTLARR